MTNWSGNYTYGAPRIHRPNSVAELQEIVGRAERVKALGSRHCFNDIADTPGDLIDTSGLPAEVDVHGSTVTANAGMKYGTLASSLQDRSLALANLASLPHISIAGAIATGTHGSGVGNQGLAGAVDAIEIVTGNGELRTITRGDDSFSGAVVGLGALGLITRVSLDVQPTFDVRQDVFENLPWAELEANFDAIVSSAYSVSLFSDLQGPTVSQVWCKSRIGAAGGRFDTRNPDTRNSDTRNSDTRNSDTGEFDRNEPDTAESAVFDERGRVRSSFFGATPATVARHPLPGLAGDVCTPQLGVPGPWFERLPHFQLGFTPSNGEELQAEYLVDREDALEVLGILRGMSSRIAPVLQVNEIRTVAADELWLSPAYRRDSVAFHFTWVRDQPAVEGVLRDIEAAIATHRPRPHWGKLFAADAAWLGTVYERLADFRLLAERLDPQGVFRNDYLDRYVFAD